MGYYSIMVLMPELETGVVVLINKSDPGRAPELFNLGWSVCMLAAGLEPLEAGSETFIGKNIRVLLVVVILLLVIGLVWSVSKIRRATPQQRRKLTVPMILLAVVDLLLAGGLLFIRLPENKDTLSLALRFTPDVGLMYVLLLVLTLGWGTLRTILFFARNGRRQT